MKIAFYNRPNNNIEFGGDLVQMEKTRASLLQIGNVDISDFSRNSPDELIAWNPDIVHIFGVYGETYRFIKTLRRFDNCPPIVLSTIYLSLSQLYWAQNLIYQIFMNNQHQLLSSLRNREGYNSGSTYRNSDYYEVFNMVDGWLPNGVGELYDIRNDFGVTKQFQIVPNSISDEFFQEENDNLDIESEFDGIGKPFIIVVGRIEPRKNQAMLLYALRDIDIPILFVGQKSDEGYWNMCKGIRKFYHCDYISHSELKKIYSMDCIYVLPSWLESPSLATMEALASNCPVVIGNQGTEYEYFGNYAVYVDPANYDEIRDKVMHTLENRELIKERIKGFRKIAEEEYIWSKTADKTFEFYLQILGS